MFNRRRPISRLVLPVLPASFSVLVVVLLGMGIWLGVLVRPLDGLHAQAERPTMPNMDPTSRLAPPPMSDPPTHLEWGRYNYYLSCMVCHGDRGQGLTDEWRTAGNADGENCWQARCHASSHPPEGFDLPRYVPPVLGEYALLRFQTVGDLQTYLQTTMPWYAPGLLDDETYWQLAAYLAQANGAQIIPDNPDWVVLADMPLRETASLPVPEGLADGQLSDVPAAGREPERSWLPEGIMVLAALGVSVALGIRRRL